VTRDVLVVQHQDDCPPGWVGDWLIEEGCHLDVRRPYAGEQLPADLAGHGAMLVLGGSMGAHDDDGHPWLPVTKALVRDAVDRRTPTLGICLGHQLAAAALGGESRPNPRGQQLGLLGLGWTDAAGHDELVQGVIGAEHGVFWNDDVVVNPPTGTVALARTPAGELQAARFAPTVWGVQLHPEVDEQILRTWAADDQARYDEGVLDAVLEKVAAHRDRLESSWRPLGEGFARQVAERH
jgi:GMP synthase (glutamine-hydrolysing)